MLTDITGSDGVEIQIKQDGRVIWINERRTGECLVRICQIKGPIEIKDNRPKAILKLRNKWK